LTELLSVDTKRKEMLEIDKGSEIRFVKIGSVEVIAGCMFSGKTEELMRRLRRAKIAKHQIQVFKSDLDVRYNKDKLASHSGKEFEATPVKEVQQIKKLLRPHTSVVAIDEAQFFGNEIIPFVQELADNKYRVIVAGLDADFRGEPFGAVPILMAQADKLKKFYAICMVCGESASFTQRLINGRPARYEDPIVVVGASELYEARCRDHHEVPGKPQTNIKDKNE